MIAAKIVDDEFARFLQMMPLPVSILGPSDQQHDYGRTIRDGTSVGICGPVSGGGLERNEPMAKLKTPRWGWALRPGPGHFFKECLGMAGDLDEVDLFVEQGGRRSRPHVSPGI